MPTSSSPELQNPNGEWRFTWEAQSHIPTLRLFLFNPNNPNLHATALKAAVIVEHFMLAVSFSEAEAEAEAEAETVLSVPIPRVLIDVESPIQCRAFSDHIEVKLVLLLPVDHPLVSEFDSLLSLTEQAAANELRPLSMDSDVKKLSALEDVHFYCRNCSTKLTTALRCFEEMLSVNWRDVADSWFGACCCSFGGISEKMVTRYAESYTFSPGLCHLSITSVILCKDDLIGCELPCGNGDKGFESESKSADHNYMTEASLDNKHEQEKVACHKSQTMGMQAINGEVRRLCPQEDSLEVDSNSGAVENVVDNDSLSSILPASHTAGNEQPSPDDPTNINHNLGNCDTKCCTYDSSISNEEKSETNIELLENQKIFLNGYLGDGFMARSSGISKDIQWNEYLCPQCSCLLGAYPCSKDQVPLDGRVRLFKCYISTSLPVSGSADLFKNYTLERMFTSELLESSKEELSFRTVVRDLETNDPMLHIVLLNPNSWCYTGYCLHSVKPTMRMDMHPAIKVLFSACNYDTDLESRKLAEWGGKIQTDEVYMLPTQVKELVSTLELRNTTYPSSHTFQQGFLLSSLKR